MATPHLAQTGLPVGPDHSPGEFRAGEVNRPDSPQADDEITTTGATDRPVVRSWPLLLLALPAAVAVWSGWVGIGQLTGFGEVRPLPGIWSSLHIDSAVTLPVGVEAYAAYALHAWLAAGARLTGRTRRFAKWSATGSLLLGMAGQVAYHLLTEAGATRAPWAVTTAVACLPVLILGMAAGLTHLIRADALASRGPGPPCGETVNPGSGMSAGRLAEARAAAVQLVAAGQRVSRRSLRAAGLHGSNADLGVLARLVGPPAGERPVRLQSASSGPDRLVLPGREHAGTSGAGAAAATVLGS